MTKTDDTKQAAAYTLEWNAEDLFGDAPETATEEE